MTATQDGEFELIDRYLSALGAARDDVCLGPGDDAALLDAGANRITVALASAADTADPLRAAREPLAAALDALRLAGARPAWATLALSLPAVDEIWLVAFARALHEGCRTAGVRVVGGDTTGGGAAVTLFLTGLIPPGDTPPARES